MSASLVHLISQPWSSSKAPETFILAGRGCLCESPTTATYSFLASEHGSGSTIPDTSPSTTFWALLLRPCTSAGGEETFLLLQYLGSIQSYPPWEPPSSICSGITLCHPSFHATQGLGSCFKGQLPVHPPCSCVAGSALPRASSSGSSAAWLERDVTPMEMCRMSLWRSQPAPGAPWLCQSKPVPTASLPGTF